MTPLSPRRRLGAALIGTLATCVVLLTGASSAWAGVGLGVTPNIPTPNANVVVGQTYASSLRIVNVSDDAQGDDQITLDTITLVPSCGVIASVDCPVPGYDPDVFALSATGTGRTGTAASCDGKVFNINNLDENQDKYEFVPAIPATPVVLGPSAPGLSDECIIDFTVLVRKMPTKDSRGDPGVQTNELGGANGTAEDNQTGQGTGTNFTTVLPGTPTVATQVTNATRTLGQPISDTATIGFTPGAETPTGTVVFTLFGPDDDDCTGGAIFTSAPIPLNGSAQASSGDFTPIAPGTYRWIAAYGGDINYNAATGLCNDPNEAVLVNQATPGISTQVSNATRTLGQPFTDTATLTFPAAAPTPTGTVTFRVYAPGDTTCTGAVLFTSTNPLNGSAVATSDAFTPTTTGTFRVIATYNGDSNYTTIAGLCTDANEQVVVNPVTPGISTQVSNATRTLGQSFTDTATLTFPQGAATPTGNVTFNVYAPGDTNCTGAVLFTSTNPLNASAAATSASFTPATVGTYRVIATYNGDSNYNTVAGLCTDANEQVVVNPATPGISTQVSNATRTLGQSFTDTATLTFPQGAATPTGTVTFNVYGPGDTTCTGTVLFTSTNPLNASAAATSGSFTPTAVGTYRVIAVYNGDTNYNTVSGLCTDANEQVVVNPATPGISTQVSNATRTLGQSFTDTATLTFPQGSPTPTGNVTFRVYAPGDTTCTGTVVFTSTNALNGSAVATSGSFTPASVGTYRVIATYNGDANYNSVAGLCADANEQVVVNPVTPGISTQVSNATRTLGQSFTDTATLTFPQGAATPTGNVTFRVYAPGDTTCTGTVVFTSTNALNGSAVATSGSFTPTAVGTYRVIATYNGDANYNTVAGACADANEQVVVNPATPGISTQVSHATRVIGQPFTDTATLTFPQGAPTPTGNVTFRVYAPGDATCTGTVVFTSANRALNGSAVATSEAFTPQSPGTYRVIATYNGDANYNTVAGACADANEQVVVSQATPTITTQASDSVLLGGQLVDNATVNGRVNPVDGGTITFRLYGPNNAICSGEPIYTSPAIPYPAAGGSVASPAYTPTAPGDYRWIATYSGDANNVGVVGLCNDANELTTVTTPPPPPPPVVVPPPPPPPVVPPPPPPPAQDVSPDEETPRGTATISGKTGCQGTPFNVLVNGRQVERVIFSMDGRVVRTLTRPNSGSRYKLAINPRRLRNGTHRVLARIIFTRASGTNSRTLRVVFSRCARRANLPAFTG